MPAILASISSLKQQSNDKERGHDKMMECLHLLKSLERELSAALVISLLLRSLLAEKAM
jgi:hypothetical protein